MAILTSAENSANKENYQVADDALNQAISAIETLKADNPAIKAKVTALEEAYEQSLRLKRMRNETLESHVSDRDSELVVLRKVIVASKQQAYVLRVFCVVLCVIIAVAFAETTFPGTLEAGAELVVSLYARVDDRIFAAILGAACMRAVF